MGGSFKLFGKGFAEQIIGFTAKPLVGLFVGILATSLVQSSSATTSIIVGLTASGALTISGAIPMIMGANIGTSITNTIVSLAHIRKKEEFKKAFEIATIHDFFNLMVVIVLLPLELSFHILERGATYLTSFFLGSSVALEFSSPLDLIIKPVAKYIQALLANNALIILILALALLFLSLHYFVKTIRPLAESEFKHFVHQHFFKTPLRSLLFGLILTAAVQSSSVSTSLVVPLAAVGILNIRKIFPYILGANVGTTFTALLASLAAGSPAGVTVALVHLLFNVFGSILVYPLKEIPLRMSQKLTKICLKSKILPLAYIASLFFAVPFLIIYLFH